MNPQDPNSQFSPNSMTSATTIPAQNHKPFLITVVVVLILGGIALIYSYLQTQKADEQEAAVNKRALAQLEQKRAQNRVTASGAAAQNSQVIAQNTNDEADVDAMDNELSALDIDMSADMKAFEDGTK